MESFARVVLGYHGCDRSFSERLLTTGDVTIWQGSAKPHDWLGRGIYFWEHAPARAMRWAREKGATEPDVVGAVIQLGRCFDLMDERFGDALSHAYDTEKADRDARGELMPENKPMPGRRDDDLKNRRLDCFVINACLQGQSPPYQTVRGAFWEGPPAFPGAMIRRESHIQIAVRDRNCILGVFRPTGLV